MPKNVFVQKIDRYLNVYFYGKNDSESMLLYEVLQKKDFKLLGTFIFLSFADIWLLNRSTQISFLCFFKTPV